MAEARTNYTYEYRNGRQVCHRGETTDLEQRESQHRRNCPCGRGRAVKVGGKKTYTGALRWQDNQPSDCRTCKGDDDASRLYENRTYGYHCRYGDHCG